MTFTWRTLGAATLPAIVVAGALVLASCASQPEQLAPGTPRAQVLQALGLPTASYAPTARTAASSHCAPGGSTPSTSEQASKGSTERLQYSMQPAGQRVYNVDLDASGRLVRAEQALNEALFAQRIRANCWTREDVLREYGPPARIEAVHNFNGQIWVWRYADGPTWRLLFIDVDPQGVVRGYSSGDEPLPEPRDTR